MLVALERKKHIIMCLMIRDCYYLPPLSQLRFLFANALSASGIVVLCSGQNFISVSHEKSTLKSRLRFFSKIESNSIGTKKSRIVTALVIDVMLALNSRGIDLLQMSEVIMSYCATHQQDKNMYIGKMKLRDALYDVIKTVFPCV